MKSFIRWAGSKRRLIPVLERFVPPTYSRYVEPFSGSACVFFHLTPRAAILCDLNADLMSTYAAVAGDVDLVLQCFRRLPVGEAHYYRIRRTSPALISEAEAAARFLYLNRYCFNGLYRTNRVGDFNVPYGPPRKPLTEFQDRVRLCASALAGVKLECGDFSVALDAVAANDFVYLDPPFAVERRRVFAEYLPNSFARSDLERLAEWLAEVDRRGAIFLLSYAYCAEAVELANRWSWRIVRTQRHISGFAGSRRRAYEILCSNRSIEVGGHDELKS